MMRDYPKHFPVNWIDGMKINKGHFIAQDNAWTDALHEVGALATSPVRFGILPATFPGEDTFNVKLSLDNQQTLRVSVLSCQAVTPGGIRINLPAFNGFSRVATDGAPALSFSFSFQEAKAATEWRVILTVNPFDKQPAGNPDLAETPPRYPYVLPSYTIQLVSEHEYNQYMYHPYAITVGKVLVNGNNVSVDYDYIPPCYSLSASPDLVNLHAEIDQFMARLEILCSQVVQKIFQKDQQNDISKLVLFLCDRVVLYLGQAITHIRWMMLHESPAALFQSIANLARVMKNTIDLRIGSGKDLMVTYLSDWSELKQGELESLLAGMANIRYDNNDINSNIGQITVFVETTRRLFEKLNTLEFIGKQKDTGPFVKEEKLDKPEVSDVNTKRRFFGSK
jgi:hypothetical protein